MISINTATVTAIEEHCGEGPEHSHHRHGGECCHGGHGGHHRLRRPRAVTVDTAGINGHGGCLPRRAKAGALVPARLSGAFPNGVKSRSPGSRSIERATGRSQGVEERIAELKAASKRMRPAHPFGVPPVSISGKTQSPTPVQV